jgi:hypothetical protein
MSNQTFEDQLNDLLDVYEKGQAGKRDNRETALNEEAQFIATFLDVRKNELRPAMEKLGGKLRQRDHDYSITEGDFRPPHGARAEPDEAFIKMSVYLSHLKDRTRSEHSKVPYINFISDHRNKKIKISISDYTETGGSVTKMGEFDIKQLNAIFLGEKFLFLFQRLAHK